jgi:hypothetical protein
MDEKLKALQLSGLVDFDKKEAKYVIRGNMIDIVASHSCTLTTHAVS